MKKALVVVDMLNDFCSTEGVLATSPITGETYAKIIITPVKILVEKFRTKKDTIVWLADTHDEDDKEFDRFPKHAVRGTWGSRIISELKPDWVTHSAHEYRVEKTRYSGFYKTELENLLEVINPTEVTVVGVCTNICVMDTIGGLANRDYNVVVPKDCVADFNPEAHWHAMERIETLYGDKLI